MAGCLNVLSRLKNPVIRIIPLILTNPGSEFQPPFGYCIQAALLVSEVFPDKESEPTGSATLL